VSSIMREAFAPPGLPGLDETPAEYVPCCYGSASDGPAGCTCWRPPFDSEQLSADRGGPCLAGGWCPGAALRWVGCDQKGTPLVTRCSTCWECRR
jgi:hypothetical protein